MKNIRFAVVSVILVLMTVASRPVFGGSKKKKATPAPASYQSVISSVKANTIGVSDAKTTRAFTITQFTEININGQRATIADLKPGMTIDVTIGMDPSRASRINAADAPMGRSQKKK
jgi:predicted negative regulator of RcsB-dependent stress response